MTTDVKDDNSTPQEIFFEIVGELPKQIENFQEIKFKERKAKREIRDLIKAYKFIVACSTLLKDKESKEYLAI